MGLVLRKMVDKYLSNINAQTRVGIEGQLAGLWFGPDEYLVEKRGCPSIFSDFYQIPLTPESLPLE